MPLEGEYEPSQWAWVREQTETFERTGGAKANTLRGVPIVMMTTRGVKSGKLRKVPVMRVEHDGVYAAVASKGGDPRQPGWYHNLVAEPHIELQDGAERWDARARLAEGEERAIWWERAVAVWPDYADYQTKTDREIPVFLLERFES